VIDGVIFIYGGEEPSLLDGGVHDRHWMLATRVGTQRWQPAPPLVVHGVNGAVLEETLMIAGGSTRHGALSLAGWSSALQIMKRAPVPR
jgi:hypothetical protein